MTARLFISPRPPGLLCGGCCVPSQALNLPLRGQTWRPSALSAPAAISPPGFGVPKGKERKWQPRPTLLGTVLSEWRTPPSDQLSAPGERQQVILPGRLSSMRALCVGCRGSAPRGLGEAGAPPGEPLCYR